MSILIFFTKLSGIDPCEKDINILSRWAYLATFMACSKLEAIAIFVVNQACGNDIIPAVHMYGYILPNKQEDRPICLVFLFYQIGIGISRMY